MPSRPSPASARAKGGQAARKRTPPPKPPREISWGVVAASAVVAIFIIGIIVYAVFNRSSGDTTDTVAQGNAAKAKLRTTAPPWPVPSNEADYIAKAGLAILPQETLAVHYHAHLDVFDNGKKVDVPANIGIVPTAGLSALHTHTDDGVLHIESPKDVPFKLGQAFTEWGVTLDQDQIGGLKATPDAPFKVYVNGKLQRGDPGSIVLKSHQEIAVVYGTAPKTIPAKYDFPQGE